MIIVWAEFIVVVWSHIHLCEYSKTSETRDTLGTSNLSLVEGLPLLGGFVLKVFLNVLFCFNLMVSSIARQ